MSNAPPATEGRPSDKVGSGAGETMGNSYLTRPYLRHPHDFNTGCCGCTEDCRNCLDTYFCWHCIVTSQYNAAEKELKHGPCLCSYCCLITVADLFMWGCASRVCVCLTRSKIRKGFGFSQSCKNVCLDGLACAFCVGCMACQNHREMHMRGYYADGCYGKPRNEWLYPSGGSVLEPRPPSNNPDYSQQQYQPSHGDGHASYGNNGVAYAGGEPQPQPQPY